MFCIRMDIPKSLQGKESTWQTERNKMMQMECKLTDKNLEKMLADGHVDGELGMNMPLMDTTEVKTESVDEDVKVLRDILTDLK